MKSMLVTAALAGLLSSSASQAASLCNCCGASTVAACTAACSAVTVPEGQCLPAVDYDARAEIGEGVNPLYDVPLQSLSLGQADRAQIELFRRLMEASRRGAEKDRRLALRAYARGKIDRTEAERLNKRYEDAIVNYYLGINAFRAARAK